MTGEFWKKRRVLVTGHTGFKGSWLSEWLLSLGAEVAGLSLEPETRPALFLQLDLSTRIGHHQIGDIRDQQTVSAALTATRPDVIFHLAAQPLVRQSYLTPLETFQANVMGTLHLPEAVRQNARPCTVIIATSDKCYQNREWVFPYRENDSLGGNDPYSASKAMTEIAAHAYRTSFFNDAKIRIATARAGNVMGGGDWSKDRIVPDMVKSLRKGEPVPVRNPRATRPWQHVLEPLGGYLQLARALHATDETNAAKLASAFNFGPSSASNRTVAHLVETFANSSPDCWIPVESSPGQRESGALNVSSDKAWHLLGWLPKWSFEQAVEVTRAWYEAPHSWRDAPSQDLIALARKQIASFTAS
jgi:CDP-glucose 4,6-dehydratase